MKAENIKFKAKRLDGKGWTIGDLLHSYENGVIIVPIEGGGAFSVDPDTICQFIGLKDKNGVEIFEHDYVSAYREGEVIFELGEFSLKTDVITVPLSMFMKDVLGNIRSKTNIDLLVLGSKFDRKEGEV